MNKNKKIFKKLILMSCLINLFSCKTTQSKIYNQINKEYEIKNYPYEYHYNRPKTEIIGSKNINITNKDIPNNSNLEFKDNTNYLETKYFEENYFLKSVYNFDKSNLKDLRLYKLKQNIPDATYSKEKISDLNVSSNNIFDYEESKKNNFLYKINQEKKYAHDDEININIFEAKISKKDIDLVKHYYPNVKINLDTKLLDNDKIHALRVISSFLDSNLNNKVEDYETKRHFNYKINLFNYDYDQFNANLNVRGIVSMSYGYQDSHGEMRRFNKNGIYFDKIHSPYFIGSRHYFSNALNSKLYVENNQLRVVALGNFDPINNDRYFNSSASKFYMVMSPEVQKIARNDVILAKNIFSKETLNSINSKFSSLDISNSYNILNSNKLKRYFEPENLSSDKKGYDAKALFLRSFTVATEGIIDNIESPNKKLNFGSSLSAPKISKIAYDIKRKFPWMSWNQVKQTILTTADKDNTGYLNNYVGWGIVNKNKALGGPTDFNAGLIEEEKYYKGNIDRIFENYNINSNNHNVYFWADIPNGIESVFENDITSGLSGDGNDKSYIVYDIIGNPNGDYSVKQNYKLKLPKVLDSERNYYSNIKQAGLRKAGKGTLILKGKQLYKTNTQVLEGSLNLLNDSNSYYQVFNTGIFNIGKKEENKKDIHIFNDIQNDGLVSFNQNTNLNNYYASKTSTTNIQVGKIIKANEFLVSGKLLYNFVENTSLDIIKNSIVAKKVDLKDAKFQNPFLRPLLIDNTLIETIKSDDSYGQYFKTLGQLSKEKLRNIPSYDDNANKFFDSYDYEKYNLIIYKAPTYNPYKEKPELISKSKLIEKDSILFNLINYKADSLEKAKSELFTDVYSNIVIAEIDRSNEIKNLSLDNSSVELQNKNIAFRITTNYIKTLNNNPRYSKLNSKLNGYLLALNIKATNNISVNSNLAYFYGSGLINNDLSGISIYNANTFSIGLGLNANLKGIYGKGNLIFNYNITNGNRFMQNNIVNYKLDSFNLISNLGMGYKYKFLGNFEINPEINYTNMIYNINKFKENTNLLNNPYKIDISKNTIIKHNVDLGIKFNYNTSILSYFTKLKVDFDLKPINKLNTKIMNIEYNSNIESLYKIKGIFELGLKKQIKNHTIEAKTMIDTNLKVGLSASYEFRF